MINRTDFFEKIRDSLFSGTLKQPQVDGFNHLLDEWEATENTDERQLAYILATVYHETGKTIQPVKEYGGEAYLQSKKYYPYYGRDLVQTTWKDNYEKVKQFSGIDVVTLPQLIGQMPLAAKVAITFMQKGWYTGKKLSDYFNEEKEDYFNARRIINGTDRAGDIAEYAKEFHQALSQPEAA